MSDLTPERLDEIERGAKKATPGPWASVECGIRYFEIRARGRCIALDLVDKPDAEHIANMDPGTTLALVAEVKRLREVEGRLREVHSRNVQPDWPEPRCYDCDDVWPCDTIRALGEDA